MLGQTSRERVMSKRKRRLQMQRRSRPTSANVDGRQHRRYQELVEKHLPGTPRETWIDPRGTNDEWEVKLFHAWLNGRDIPVEELCILFSRDEATIRRWLKMSV